VNPATRDDLLFMFSTFVVRGVNTAQAG